MDFGELKKQSDLSYDIATAKANALERAKSRQQFAYNGHLFMADSETICLVKTLSELHTSPFCVLDTNQNPVKIDNPKEFLQKLIEKNQETLNAYYEIHQSFTKRS
jgi:hypothetical protein